MAYDLVVASPRFGETIWLLARDSGWFLDVSYAMYRNAAGTIATGRLR